MINDGISDEKLTSFVRIRGGYLLYIRVYIFFVTITVFPWINAAITHLFISMFKIN